MINCAFNLGSSYLNQLYVYSLFIIRMCTFISYSDTIYLLKFKFSAKLFLRHNLYPHYRILILLIALCKTSSAGDCTKKT